MPDEKIEEKIEDAQQTAADALEGVSDVATDLEDHTEEDEALWDALKNEILEPLIREVENLKLEISTIRTDLSVIAGNLQSEIEELRKPKEEPEKSKEEPEKPKEEQKVEPEPEPALPIEPVETIVEEKPDEKPKQRIRFI